LPVFLAFLHARIARQKPFLFQDPAQLSTELDERARDTVLDSAGLTVRSSAGYAHMNVEFIESIRGFQRPLYQHPVGFIEEVCFEIPVIDCEVSGTGPENHTRRGSFPAARAQVLN
jgi:hypothetical protein